MLLMEMPLGHTTSHSLMGGAVVKVQPQGMVSDYGDRKGNNIIAATLPNLRLRHDRDIRDDRTFYLINRISASL
jgi:hypothetical protein